MLDASLLADNLYFIKTREEQCRDMTIPEITRAIADCFDIIYFSARKLGFGRGGGICIRDEALYKQMRGLVPMYEGFLTYGGMSVREMEAITVGLDETMDEDMINQGPQFIEHMVNELDARGIPVITPAGGLGAHVDAMRLPAPRAAERVPGGGAGVGVVRRVRRPRHGARHPERAARRGRRRTAWRTWSSCGWRCRAGCSRSAR